MVCEFISVSEDKKVSGALIQAEESTHYMVVVIITEIEVDLLLHIWLLCACWLLPGYAP